MIKGLVKELGYRDAGVTRSGVRYFQCRTDQRPGKAPAWDSPLVPRVREHVAQRIARAEGPASALRTRVADTSNESVLPDVRRASTHYSYMHTQRTGEQDLRITAQRAAWNAVAQTIDRHQPFATAILLREIECRRFALQLDETTHKRPEWANAVQRLLVTVAMRLHQAAIAITQQNIDLANERLAEALELDAVAYTLTECIALQQELEPPPCGNDAAIREWRSCHSDRLRYAASAIAAITHPDGHQYGLAKVYAHRADLARDKMNCIARAKFPTQATMRDNVRWLWLAWCDQTFDRALEAHSRGHIGTRGLLMRKAALMKRATEYLASVAEPTFTQLHDDRVWRAFRMIDILMRKAVFIDFNLPHQSAGVIFCQHAIMRGAECNAASAQFLRDHPEMRDDEIYHSAPALFIITLGPAWEQAAYWSLQPNPHAASVWRDVAERMERAIAWHAARADHAGHLPPRLEDKWRERANRASASYTAAKKIYWSPDSIQPEKRSRPAPGDYQDTSDDLMFNAYRRVMTSYARVMQHRHRWSGTNEDGYSGILKERLQKEQSMRVNAAMVRRDGDSHKAALMDQLAAAYARMVDYVESADDPPFQMLRHDSIWLLMEQMAHGYTQALNAYDQASYRAVWQALETAARAMQRIVEFRLRFRSMADGDIETCDYWTALNALPVIWTQVAWAMLDEKHHGEALWRDVARQTQGLLHLAKSHLTEDAQIPSTHRPRWNAARDALETAYVTARASYVATDVLDIPRPEGLATRVRR